jgi:murein L,D-transpeptidase YcbB/YkuD
MNCRVAMVCFLVLSLPFSTQAKDLEGGVSETQVQIEHILKTRLMDTDDESEITLGLLNEIYTGVAYQPLWTDVEKSDELIELLNASDGHGLLKADYNVEEIKTLTETVNIGPNPRVSAELDILRTEGLMLYAYHRRYGKVKARELDPDFNFTRKAFSNKPPAEIILELLNSDSLTDFIETAAPTGTYYHLLQQQLLRYQNIAANGGWPEIEEGPTLRSGDSDPRVSSLRTRLIISGDLQDTAAVEIQNFDEELKTAVETFQERHLLDSDGIVGKQSFASMNVPVQTRIDQLRLSLERLRWVAHDALDEFIAVNIAGFRLAYFTGREISWTTRVMVGKTYRKTPVFRGDISYLEFNPTWTIPPTILRVDTLPQIKKNPQYLSSKNISVIDSAGKKVDPLSVDWSKYSRGIPYTLRQEPGPQNALGLVKFIFPNPHFVFLHDTPHRELFDYPERAFSSGCIRVEDPFKLAELILKGTGRYGQAEFQQILDSGRTQRVVLENPLPVLILYLTAALDSSGNAMFFKDIYSRDEPVLAALNGAVVIDLPAKH